MNNEAQKFKGHWIRCVARGTGGAFWECLVYVFVSRPGDGAESEPDACFHTRLRNFGSEEGALLAGFEHAHSLIEAAELGTLAAGTLSESSCLQRSALQPVGLLPP